MLLIVQRAAAASPAASVFDFKPRREYNTGRAVIFNRGNVYVLLLFEVGQRVELRSLPRYIEISLMFDSPIIVSLFIIYKLRVL